MPVGGRGQVCCEIPFNRYPSSAQQRIIWLNISVVSIKKSDVWDRKMKEIKLMEVIWTTALIVIDKKWHPRMVKSLTFDCKATF